MEHKCRAKRKSDNQWVDGFYVKDDKHYIVQSLKTIVRGTAELVDVHEIDETTIRRFTGKADKNDVDIVEGDIIRHFNYIKYIVRYGAFAEKVGFGYYYGLGFYLERVQDAAHKVPFSTISCDNNEYEVIGNIYDNPELLQTED